jgi:hypothetical protein
MNKGTMKNTNRDIKKIFIEDQDDRRNMKFDRKNLQLLKRKDQKRKERLSKLLKSGARFIPKDFYMVAMIYQHGSTLSDYKKAVHFSHQSMKLGFEKAKWLYAAAQDRLLMKQGRKQKYGTQYQKRGNIWFLYPVSKSIGDKEREKYNVPTLKKALLKLSELNKS